MLSLLKFLFHKPHNQLGKTSRSSRPAANSRSADPGSHGGRHAQESGQSSRDSRVKKDYYCSICMEDKYSFECITMQGCAHTYCGQCVRQYVVAKVEANEVWIGCPEPECGAGLVDPDICRLILPAEMLERWEDRLCEEGIPRQARFYCPHKECAALLIHEEGGGGEEEVVVKAACPYCNRWVCGRCRVVWHQQLTCKQYQELAAKEEQAKRQLLELASKKKWKRCPSCGFVIEKRSGCNYIRCWCKTAFCYNCEGPVDDRTHKCPSCRPLFLGDLVY